MRCLSNYYLLALYSFMLIEIANSPGDNPYYPFGILLFSLHEINLFYLFLLEH